MQLLIVTPNYNPDLGPSAPLYTMLSESLVERGHQVTVITAVPHYPTGQVPIEYRGKWFQRSDENGVTVIRVGLPSLKRESLIQRVLQFLAFQVGATLAEIGQKYDATIVANPALQTWLPFTWATILKRRPAIFSVHDVYPDVGIRLGIFTTRAQIAFVSWLERFCLDHASVVRILSDSFRPGLGDLKVAASKISLVHDWVDTDLIRPLPRENQFSQQYGLCESFVVMYAGNIGLSQGLEKVLDTARLLEDHRDVQFVIVGDGTGLASLKAEVAQAQSTNVHFIPFQPRQRLPEVLASASTSLVILKPGIGAASLPSKIFSIMASGRPILICVDKDSEAWRLIEQAGAGIWVDPENPKRLAEAILMLKRDDALREKLGCNGRQWSEQHHSARYSAEQFERLLVRAVNRC